jgi:hypothetical protein
MTGHRSRRETGPWTEVSAIWAMVVVSCGLSGCLRADPKTAGPTVPLGSFVPWPAYESAPEVVPRPDAGARWVAFAEREQRLRVWALSDAFALGGLLFDSNARGVTVAHHAWCGSTLLYCGWVGKVDFGQLDMEPPAEGRAAYLAARACSLAWDPVTGDEGRGVPAGFRVAVANRAGSKLVVGGGEISIDTALAAGENLLRILRMPGFELVSAKPFDLGGTLRDDAWAAVSILGWDEEGFYAIGEAVGPMDPGHYEVPLPVLLFADSSGSVHHLTEVRGLRLAGGHAHRPPVACLLHDGSGVAARVVEWASGRAGVAVYDRSGLLREYRFSVRHAFPPKLTEVSPWWRLIVCTRDGKHALFQETRDARDPQDHRDGPWWVYLWDLEQETYKAIVQMNEIYYCFDWLSDTALVVGTRAETVPPEATSDELYDYGVLHLPKPDRGTALDGE